MLAIKTYNMRNDFKHISDLVSAGEKVLISRPSNKNLVVISEAEYNELERLRQNAEYLSKLDRSRQQLAEGKIVVKTMDELEAMAQ